MNGVCSKKMDKQKRSSHFPLCDYLGPTSSGVFRTKTAMYSFIILSVDSYSYITSM